MAEVDDVVVVLPGIMGSVLEREGGDRWALTPSALLRALTSRGDSLYDLALAGPDDWRRDLTDGVTATRLLDDAHLIPGLWKVDGYSTLVRFLTKRVGLVEGENLRLFPYDWRRDNRAHAARLAVESERWLADQRARGAADPRLILIGHSMGGLVARCFLEVFGGWRSTRRLITYGTPYRGSVNAVDTLANGIRKLGVQLDGITTLGRSLTSIYQLLPTYRCLDTGSGELHRVGDVAVPNLDPAYLQLALDFHREIEEHRQRNLDDAEYRDNGYRIHPIVGIEQDTLVSAIVGPAGVECLDTYDGRELRGDGTVPFPSAFPQEWDGSNHPMSVATKHASLHNRDDGLTQLDGLIRSATIDFGDFRSDPDVGFLRVGNADLYDAGDIEIAVHREGGSGVHAELESLDDDRTIVGASARGAGEPGVVFPGVTAGGWRLRVEAGPHLVEDLILVV